MGSEIFCFLAFHRRSLLRLANSMKHVPSQSGSPIRRRRGVTLIEAIAVILLLSAAAATSVIYLDGNFLNRRGAAIATKHVGDTLMLARNTAVLHQTNVRVSRSIDRDRGIEQLQITQEAGPVQDEKTWAIDLPEGTSVTGSDREIVFDPYGSADRELTWAVSHDDVSGKVNVSLVNSKVIWSTP